MKEYPIPLRTSLRTDIYLDPGFDEHIHGTRLAGACCFVQGGPGATGSTRRGADSAVNNFSHHVHAFHLRSEILSCVVFHILEAGIFLKRQERFHGGKVTALRSLHKRRKIVYTRTSFASSWAPFEIRHDICVSSAALWIGVSLQLSDTLCAPTRFVQRRCFLPKVRQGARWAQQPLDHTIPLHQRQ